VSPWLVWEALVALKARETFEGLLGETRRRSSHPCFIKRPIIVTRTHNGIPFTLCGEEYSLRFEPGQAREQSSPSSPYPRKAGDGGASKWAHIRCGRPNVLLYPRRLTGERNRVKPEINGDALEECCVVEDACQCRAGSG